MNKNESKYFNTAKKMNDALIELLETKDFEYITVKEICNKAGVNRSTFYLHYTNTNDILEEVISSLSLSFKEYFQSDIITNKILNNNDLEELYLIKDEYLLPYLEFIKINQKVYKAIKSNISLFQSDKAYENMFNTIFSPILKKFGLENKWHKYIMDFYINGISAIILNWVNDNCLIDIKSIADLIKNLIYGYNQEKNY